MPNHTLCIYGTNLANEQALPANASIIGNGGGQSTGGLLGHTEIVMVATSPVRLNVGKSISMALEDSHDNEVFTPMHRKNTQIAMFALCEWDTDEVITRIALPSGTREYVRVVISTDDDAITGQVDVMLNYIPLGGTPCQS